MTSQLQSLKLSKEIINWNAWNGEKNILSYQMLFWWNLEMSNILITGGNGFLGSRIVEELQKKQL